MASFVPARFLKEWREFAQIQDISGTSQAERHTAILRQSVSLLAFAAQSGCLLLGDFDALIPIDAGTEHDVFRHAATGRAWKITHPGRWQSRSDPPSEYLKNLQRLNVIAAPLDICIEGILAAQEEPLIVSSMEWINGDHPDNAWFQREMESRGWSPTGLTSFAHQKSQVIIRDAYRDNFILTPHARLIPIDLTVDPLPQGVGLHFST
jgi:hypothetical protein